MENLRLLDRVNSSQINALVDLENEFEVAIELLLNLFVQGTPEPLSM